MNHLQKSRVAEFSLLVAALLILLSLIASFALFRDYFFKQVDDILDTVSAESLVSLSSVISKSLQPSLIRDIQNDDFTSERIESEILLSEIFLAENLDNIYIVDTLGTMIYSSDKTYELGDRMPYIALSYSAFKTAKSGIATVSELLKIENDYFRFGFAPVYDEFSEIQGILILESGAGFYSGFRNLLNISNGLTILYVLIGLFFLIVVIYGFVLIRRLKIKLSQNAALVAVSRMSASMAHEIGNPLQIIGTSARRMAAQEDMQKRNVYLTYIQEEIERLSKLTERYRAITGKSQNRIIISPAKIIAPIISEYREMTDEMNITIDLIDTSSHIIEIDPHSLGQIIHNLIRNAIEVIENDGSITIEIYDVDGNVVIDIIDSGLGFGKISQKRLFEPFYSTKKDGTGIGLYITRLLIENDFGKIEAIRKADRTIFRLIYPIAE